MLLDIAVGDAFGAGFEGVDRKTIDDYFKRNRYLNYVRHPRHNITPGDYTDDTQMASVVAEAMLSGNFTRRDLADRWVKRFHQDKRLGYTSRFYNLLNHCRTGGDLLSRLSGSSGITSGAAMRAPVIGLYERVSKVKKIAKMQAEITHGASGVEAAIASALMVHYFYRMRGQKAGLRNFIAKEVRKDYARPWQKGRKVGTEGWQCVSAAIQAVMDNDNIPDLLRQCVRYGGDTDTVAAIAMAAASVSLEYRNQHDNHGNGWNKRFPVRLYSGLEPAKGLYGRNYLQQLDGRLFRKFSRN
ncbi:ADP-ribosylglycohydrolase family protein [Candidatus Woesearchaeota archaeon]|nr:ADP-ribosylglycohydrolase family protein [Candidatus Woesearchaeota archaeon]